MAKTVANTAVNNQLQNTTHASSVARQATFSDFYSIEEMLGKYVQFCCYLKSSACPYYVYATGLRTRRRPDDTRIHWREAYTSSVP